MVYFRWIYHHYCAMVMALMSLTWEIKGQPDCAMKQVCAIIISFTKYMATIFYMYILIFFTFVIVERGATIFGLGNNARICNASPE